MTESSSVEGGGLKLKLKGRKDAVMEAISRANALIREKMAQLQIRLINELPINMAIYRVMIYVSNNIPTIICILSVGAPKLC